MKDDALTLPPDSQNVLRLHTLDLGPAACSPCRIRAGFGTCSTCIVRHDRGVDGAHEWLRAVIDFLETIHQQDLEDGRQTLLKWLAGWD